MGVFSIQGSQVSPLFLCLAWLPQFWTEGKGGVCLGKGSQWLG